MVNKKFGRNENSKATRKTLLIVCEGEKTEPAYFHSFQLAKIIDVKGLGKNTVSLVEHAIAENKRYNYDEVWCVFDRDSFSKTQVTCAHALIQANKFKAAYSDESFELWYLLHFCYTDAQITRAQYCTILSTHLEFNYQKNDPRMYDLLLEKQPVAIKNAKKLEALHPLVPGKECASKPITSVYRLVERLNRLKKKYKI